MVNPILPSFPSVPGGYSGLNAPLSTLPTDSLSSSTTPLTSDWLSVLGYSGTINSSSSDLSNALYDMRSNIQKIFASFTSANNMNFEFAFSSTISQITDAITAPPYDVGDHIVSSETSGADATNTLNGALSSTEVDTFNSTTLTEDSDQVATMNSAINTYNDAVNAHNHHTMNNGDFASATTLYNSAVSSYNNYLTTRNNSQPVHSLLNAANTYNSTLLTTTNPSINTTNTTIEAFNTAQQTAFQNHTSLSLVQLATLANLTPYDTSSLEGPDAASIQSNSNTSLVDNIPTPSSTPIPASVNNPNPVNTTVDQIANELAIAPYTLLLKSIINTQDIIGKGEDYANFISYFFNGPRINLPSSYLNKLPSMTATTSNANSIGVGALSDGVSVENPFLDAIISAVRYLTATSQFSNTNISTKILNLSLQNTQNLISDASLVAALPVLGFLANQPASSGSDPASSKAITILLSLSIAQKISQAINSGQTEADIQHLLNQEIPQASKSQIAQLAETLSLGQNVTLLQTALALISESLGSTSLFSQALNSIQNSSSTPLNLTTNVNDILQNPGSVVSLKQQLSLKLAHDNRISLENAQTIINKAVDSASQNNSIKTEDDLKNDLVKSLTNQGISERESNQLANIAKSQVHSEILSNYLLDTKVSSDSINHQELIDQLTNPISGLGIDTNTASAAVSQLSTSSQETTFRTLRDQLSLSLVQNGIDPQTAQQESTLTLGSYFNLNTPQPNSLNGLRATLSQNVTALLTPELGLNAAQNIASQLVQTVLGTNDANQGSSILGRLSQALHTANKSHDKTVAEAAHNSSQTFLKLGSDLSTFANKMRDPGNNLIYSVSNGIMYSGMNTPTSLPFKAPPLQIYE